MIIQQFTTRKAFSFRHVSAICSVLILALVLGAGVVNAAEFSVRTGNGCAISLSGEFRSGDGSVFLAKAAALGLLSSTESEEHNNSEQTALCLDSMGGSYTEGGVIATAVHDHGITTRVLEGSECYSVCAFVFMAGRSLGAEIDTPSRYLHAGAKLGFHAPYFVLPADKKLSGQEVTALVTLSHEIIAEFIRFGSFKSVFDTRPMISMSLLADILDAGPAELTLVSTIEDVARWQILVEGIPDKAVISPADAVRACVNFMAWARDEKVSDSDLEFYADKNFPRVDGVIDGIPTQFLKIDTGGMEDRHCLVELPTREVSGFNLCMRDDFTGLRFGACEEGWGIWLPWYYSRVPSSMIGSLRQPATK